MRFSFPKERGQPALWLLCAVQNSRMNMHVHFSFLPASSPGCFSACCHFLMVSVITDLSCVHPQVVDKQNDTEIVSHHALNDILKAD